jgi:F0F1-type ATP synthase assembly protein I
MRGAPKDPGGNPSPSLMDLLSMGIASAVCIGLGLGAGLLVDNWLHTSPALTFVGLFLGVAAAIILTVRQVKKSL